MAWQTLGFEGVGYRVSDGPVLSLVESGETERSERHNDEEYRRGADSDEAL